MVLCGSGRVKQRNGIAGGAITGKNELEVRPPPKVLTVATVYDMKTDSNKFKK